MKPQVKLLNGYHLTAGDKRDILGCIEYLRQNPGEIIAHPKLGRQKSPKRYVIIPGAEAGIYAVKIFKNATNDYGCPILEEHRVTVGITGAEPLPDPFPR